MTIIHQRHTRNYTRIGNATLNDPRLSFEDLGLFAYLYGRPPNWEIHMQQLAKRGGIGRDKTRKIVNRLIDAGYIRRQERRDNSNGKITGYDYIVSEVHTEETSDEPSTRDQTPSMTQRATNPAPDYPEPADTDHTNSTEKEKTSTQSEGESATLWEQAGLQPQQSELENAFSVLFDNWPTKATDDRSRAFGEFRKLSPLDRNRACSRSEAYKRHVRVEMKRSVFPGLVRYLSEKLWERVPIGNQASQVPVAKLAPLSRAWCCLFFKRDEAGQSVRLMAAEARNGVCWIIRVTDVPSQHEQDRMIAVAVGSAAYNSWMEYLAQRGIRLPRPSEQHFYVPTETPPGAGANVAPRGKLEAGTSL